MNQLATSAPESAPENLPDSPRVRASRGLRDVGSVCLIAAAVVFTWVTLDRPSLGDSSGPPVPAAPVSLDGASTKGQNTARVVILEFSDFECPYCRVFSVEIMPEVERRYVDTGLVQIAFRHLPLSNLHRYAEGAARAAVCAGRAGKFWPFHDSLFGDQGRLGDKYLLERAIAVQMDPGSLEKCVLGPGAEQVARDVALAATLGIASTPTLLIGTRVDSGSMRVSDIVSGASGSQLMSAIERVLRNSEVDRKAR